MSALLIVHHTTSPSTEAMLEAVVAGASISDIEGVSVVVRAALSASASDVLAADGFIVGTPANIGYMSGAMKHFFDQVYYPCRQETAGRPYASFVHGNSDTSGAVRAIDSIAGGMGWRRAAQTVVVIGAPTRADLEQCHDLGATISALLM